MGDVADAFATWLRDNVVDGNPLSGVNQPSKAEGRAIGSVIEQAMSTAVASAVSAGGAAKIIRDVTPETGAVGTGTKHTFRLPYGVNLSEVRASLTSSGGSATVIDITIKQTPTDTHTSILSAPLQIDASATTSVGSTAPASILTHALNDNAEIHVNVTTDGGGAGLKVYLIGSWAAIGLGVIPYYVTQTYAAADAQTLAIAYPAGIELNDVAVLEVRTLGIAASGTPTIARPSGWSTIANPVGPSGSTAGDAHSDTLSTSAWFWRRLDGTETGTVTVTSTGGGGSAQGLGLLMSTFRGCVDNGDPFESALTQSGDSTTMESTTIVTLGPNRLTCNFYTCVDNANSSDPDVGWTEAYDDPFGFTFGSQMHVLSVRQMPVADTTPPETRTITNKAAWSSLSLALVPATS